MSEFPFDEFKETDFNEFERFFKTNTVNPIYDHRANFQTNSPSFYEYLAKHNHLIKILAKRIYDYDKELAKRFEEWNREVEKWNNEIDKRMEDWDNLIKKFPKNVEDLLIQWLQDGTLEHLINNVLMSKMKEEFEQKETNKIIKNITSYPNIQLNTVNNGRLVYVTLFDNSGNQITHQFLYNGGISMEEYDQYFIHSRTWSGSYELDYKEYQKTPVNNLNTFGNFTPGAENIARYTSTIGDTFEQTVNIDDDNTAITFAFYANAMGGLWEVEILDSDYEKVTLSTYTSGNVHRKIYTPFTDLPKGIYKIKGTFKGKDPSNPIENPRGWIGNTNHSIIRLSKKFAITNNTDDDLIKTPSNLEFAYNFKDKIDSDYIFAPFHQKIVSYENQPIKFYDDNGVIDFSIFDSETYYYVRGSLNIHQNVNIKYNSDGKNLMNIITTHKINNDGTINVDGNMKVLEDIYMNNSYVIMGVSKSDLFDKIVTGYDNMYTNTSDDWLATNSNEFIPESDLCKNYTFLSSKNKNLAIGFRFNDIKYTLRKYKLDKDLPENMTYIQHRNENILKIYSKLFNSSDNLVKKGFKHTFSGTYYFSNQFNIYDLLI